jgi:hypothetical protein
MKEEGNMKGVMNKRTLFESRCGQTAASSVQRQLVSYRVAYTRAQFISVGFFWCPASCLSTASYIGIYALVHPPERSWPAGAEGETASSGPPEYGSCIRAFCTASFFFN